MIYKFFKYGWNAYKEAKSIRQKKILKKRIGFDVRSELYYPHKTVLGNHTYTIISAVYGVEEYIDDMVLSLVRQTLDFKKHIQLILVDDGAVDNSGNICEKWASRYPNNIKVLHKENGGQATARNAGIPYATGDWVAFIDPDDFVDENYFLYVDRYLTDCLEQNKKYPSMVSCSFIPFYEDTLSLRDNHPQNYRFRHGTRLSIFDEQTNDIQFHVNAAFFDRVSLQKSNISFINLKPTFEDGYFCIQYLLEQELPDVLFIREAQYFYRKRADQNSALDTSWQHPDRYGKQLELGYLNLLELIEQRFGFIPRWVQRMVIYDLSWHMKRIVNNSKNLVDIPKEQRSKYLMLLKNILSKVNIENIKDFELAGVSDDHRFSMISLGHPTHTEVSRVKLFDWDNENQLLGVRYHYVGNIPNVKITIGASEVSPRFNKTRIHRVTGKATCYSVESWYPWAGNAMLNIYLNDELVELNTSQRSKESTIFRFTPKVQNIKKLPVPVKIYRNLSGFSYYKNKFKRAWLLMDRDTQADDNAEHLYRWIMKHKPNINIWFILRETSHDWARLKAEGFKLIKFESLEHKMALINAKHLVSSHADHYVLNVLKNKYYKDLMSWKFTFLQHGVISNDLSEWLNSKNIHNFITSSEKEYNSIAGDFNNYKFSDRELRLTGLPRHDNLLKMAKNKQSKTILIMPTWRRYLVGTSIGMTNKRESIANFDKSDFYKCWHAFLSHQSLKELSDRYGYNIVFFPHANLVNYLDYFRFEHVKVFTHQDYTSIQELFCSASLLITDYSSVSFEMAYLKRPVLYYQFDENEVFDGGHTSQKGYFDYREHGFGPVSLSSAELLIELEKVLKNSSMPEDKYFNRMESFFEFRDGRCCERVYNVIENS